MFFGSTTFASAPFSDIGIANALVDVTGSQVNTSVGNVTIVGDALILPNGNQYNLSTGTVTVKEGANVPVTGNRLNTDTGTVTFSISVKSNSYR
jgi:hypothetical protein